VPSTVSADVRALGAQVRMAITPPAADRAMHILQAIATECTSRGWTLGADPVDEHRFRITTAECSFEFALSEELVDRETPDQTSLDAAKYPWQRIPLQRSKVGSGRLTIRLGQYWHTKSWSDRSRWTLESRLGAMLVELDRRVADAAAQRQQREADLARRQRDWDAAVLAARASYTTDLNRRRLREQLTRRAEAGELRKYADALDHLAERCGDPARAAVIRHWAQGAQEEAQRVDPLNDPDTLGPAQPGEVPPEDLQPFMPKGFNAHRRPTA